MTEAVAPSHEHQPGVDPGRWLAQHGDAMFRYARARLANREAAEDAVQEALLAAVRGADRFDGRSAELTWLIGILRHKVHDVLRARSREGAWRDRLESELASADESFCNGQWRERQSVESLTGDSAGEREEVLSTLWACVEDLPAPMREVFLLREVDGVATSEVCSMLGITKENVWTLVHRAKVRLRRSMTARGVGPGESEGCPA